MKNTYIQKHLLPLLILIICTTFVCSSGVFAQTTEAIIPQSNIKYEMFNRPLPAHTTVNPYQISVEVDPYIRHNRYEAVFRIRDSSNRTIYRQENLPFIATESGYWELGVTDLEAVARFNARLSVIETSGKKVKLDFDYLDSLSRTASQEAAAAREKVKGQKVWILGYDGDYQVPAESQVRPLFSALDPERFLLASDENIDAQIVIDVQDLKTMNNKIEALEKRVTALESE